jgi:Uri superfamily endonuclease
MEKVQVGRMRKGSYALLVRLEEDTKIELGTGTKLLEKGFYIYFGSAFGTGGLRRIQRHREVAEGERDVKYWHIDYLTCLEYSELLEAVKFPEKDIECELAKEAEETVESFGSTDCSCRSHLAYFPQREDADAFIEDLRSEYVDS